MKNSRDTQKHPEQDKGKTPAARGSRAPQPRPQGVGRHWPWPDWPNTEEGQPDASMLRTVLFPAIQDKERKYLKSARLGTLGDRDISFMGMQLNQSDLDVWEYALALASQDASGHRCVLTSDRFLTGLRRPTDARHHEWLKHAIDRLCGCLVLVVHGKLEYFGKLIKDGESPVRDGYWRLNLNPELTRLYTVRHWTAMDWAQRHKLRGRPLALWLHAYYCGPFRREPLKVRTLHGMSGSAAASPRCFKVALKGAFRALKGSGAVDDWEIVDDLVRVKPIALPT